MRDNDTYIYRRGTTPNTRTAISQKVKIFSTATGQQVPSQIGVTASFDDSESRAVDAVRGLGYGDQIAELVPGVTDVRSLSITRTLLYLSTVYQAMGYRAGVDGLVRSLKHHQWPFDIKQELVFSRLATNENVPKQVVPATDNVNEALLTFFEACWMNSWGASFAADAAMIQETVGIMVSDIVDGVSTYGELQTDAESTGNNPFITAGSLRYNNAGVGVPVI